MSDISFIVQWLCTFHSSSHSSDIKTLHWWDFFPFALVSCWSDINGGVESVWDFYCYEKILLALFVPGCDGI